MPEVAILEPVNWCVVFRKAHTSAPSPLDWIPSLISQPEILVSHSEFSAGAVTEQREIISTNFKTSKDTTYNVKTTESTQTFQSTTVRFMTESEYFTSTSTPEIYSTTLRYFNFNKRGLKEVMDVMIELGKT